MATKRIVTVGIGVAALVAVGAVVAFAASRSSSTSYMPMGRMMGSRYAYQPASEAPVHTLGVARSDAQAFADRLGLKVGEVLQFRENFYAKLVDGNGNGATEVLVDPQTGAVSVEYGPAMMWNTRYGMGRGGARMMGSYGQSMMRSRGGMMGGSGGQMMGGSGRQMMGGYGYGSGAAGPGAPSASAPVTMATAHSLAQAWLSSHEPGVKVETGGDAFPGYYTLETLRDGKINGMISVNARTGATWPHWWHGAYVAKWEA